MNYIKNYTEYIAESSKYNWIETDLDSRGRSTGKMRVSPEESKSTMKYKVLRFIFESGKRGRRYTDIVKYIVEELHNRVYDYRTDRGYWATNLLGANSWYEARRDGPRAYGILNKYCNRNDEGRWVLTDTSLIKHFNKYDLGDMFSDDELEALADIL